MYTCKGPTVEAKPEAKEEPAAGGDIKKEESEEGAAQKEKEFESVKSQTKCETKMKDLEGVKKPEGTTNVKCTSSEPTQATLRQIKQEEGKSDLATFDKLMWSEGS